MPHFSFLKEIETVSETAVSECYQCCRCTNGCPVVRDMDIAPHRIIRYIIDGEREKVLSSKTIWVCIGCITCSSRCPNGVDVARVMEVMRKLSIEAGLEAARDTWRFDELFIESVARHGRLYELGAILRYRLHKKELSDDAAMGLDMIKKGRIGLFPHNIKDRDVLETAIRKMIGKARK